jgi:hypothetical protein
MFAATPEPGEFYFEYSDAGFCNGGLHDKISKWRHGHAFKLKVEGKHLPSYLEKNYPDLVSKIRYIKVDAEGFDYEILKSLEKLIAEVKPHIRAEVFKHTSFEVRKKLFDFLTGLDYDIYRFLGEENYCGPVVTEETLAEHRHYDIFCVPKTL